MNQALLNELRDLVSLDEATRSELAATGELFEGYHPRMAEVHAGNATALGRIIAEWGWPGKALVGDEGCEAAWIVLQHSIAHPELQRRCLPLLEAAAKQGDVPAYHVAYLDDRIRCFEGRAQRYGTQMDWDENGELSPLPLLDSARVDEWRENVGLGPLAEKVEQARISARAEGAMPPPDLDDWRRKKRQWARSVGWI